MTYSKKSSITPLLIMSSVFLCVLLLGCASCDYAEELKIPKGEECVSSVEAFGKLNCTDSRFKEGDPNFEYDRFLGQDKNGKKIKDFATNSKQYFKLKSDYVDIKAKYLVCKKYPDKCV